MASEPNITSIAKGFFYGDVNEDDIFPFPRLNDDQLDMVKAMVPAVNRFAQDNFDSEKMDIEAMIPDDILNGLAELGLFGLAVPEELGGLNLDYTLYARVFSEVAAFDGAVATTLGAHQSIGYKALLEFGSKEQKEKWLPVLATGEVKAAFCLTEPGSGSDAYSIKTKAVDNGDGTYTLKGQKLWITNGGMAGFYSVFAKTDHEVDGKSIEKITCFIVEKDMEGVSFGEKESKMGIRASETRAVYFDNVKVPKENIIGDLGKGFKIAMNVLNTGRLSLGSGSVGGMQSIIKLAVAHAKTRHQFDRPIKDFGIIQEKLSRMAADCFAAESIVYMTTGKMCEGMEDFSVESAICKVFCSEKLWTTIDQAMQISGGNGYMTEYPYERIMRDSRINLIFEGTNEILRVFIALSGIKGPSEDLKELGKITDVSKVLNDPIKSVGILSNFATKRLGKMISTKHLSNAHESLENLASDFSSMLSDFSIKVENTLFKYGKNIIGNELPQKRIADMAISLYVTLAVLSRTTTILDDDKIDQKQKDYILSLAQIACSDARHTFMENFKKMDKNLDKIVMAASEGVCERDGIGFDIIDY